VDRLRTHRRAPPFCLTLPENRARWASSGMHIPHRAQQQSTASGVSTAFNKHIASVVRAEASSSPGLCILPSCCSGRAPCCRPPDGAAGAHNDLRRMVVLLASHVTGMPAVGRKMSLTLQLPASIHWRPRSSRRKCPVISWVSWGTQSRVAAFRHFKTILVRTCLP